jgi:coatomer protein complex subunit gamma
LTEFGIKLSDYMTKMDLRKGEFKERWDSFGVEEVTQNYKLDYKTVESAVVQTIKHFGMSVCENSDNLVPSSNYHTLYLNGAFLGEEPVMLIGLIGIEAGRGCVLKLRVKTNIENLTTNIVDSIS